MDVFRALNGSFKEVPRANCLRLPGLQGGECRRGHEELCSALSRDVRGPGAPWGAANTPLMLRNGPLSQKSIEIHGFLGKPIDFRHESAWQDAPRAPELDLTERGAPMVAFQKVCFHYSRQPMGRAIKDVSFRIPRGGSLALVGTTGAGKTTITRLLFRFYDAVSGAVYIDFSSTFHRFLMVFGWVSHVFSSMLKLFAWFL